MNRARVVAVFDANVLYPAPVRDLLIRLARAGLVAARWTDLIHDEWIRNVLKDRTDLSAQQLERTRRMMDEAVPGAVVEGFERHIRTLHLPDPDDRHVLAAAIQASADVIVTFNLKDFPGAALLGHGILARHPDEFVLDLLSRDPDTVYAATRAQRTTLRNPPLSVGQYLDNLRRVGLPRTADALERAADEL